MTQVDNLPTLEQKAKTTELEQEAKAKRDEVDNNLEKMKKDLIESRKKEIAQKFLSGAENDDDLRAEIENLLSQHGGGVVGNQILQQADQ